MSGSFCLNKWVPFNKKDILEGRYSQNSSTRTLLVTNNWARHDNRKKNKKKKSC